LAEDQTFAFQVIIFNDDCFGNGSFATLTLSNFAIGHQSMLPFLRQPFTSQNARSRDDFSCWLTGEEGRKLLDVEQRELADLLRGLVGCRALQIGPSVETNLLKECRLPYQWQLSSTEMQGASLLGRPSCLPLANHCVDLVLLHHSLDFDDEPYRILSESTRILNPGGTLLVVGFNPVSLLGIQRILHRRGVPPWSGRFLRAGRVSDWAGVCGCESLGYVSGYYSHRERGVLTWLGHRFWRRLGGFYILMARKQAVPVQPVTVRRKLLADLPPNVISVPAAHWQQGKPT
jgi:SAM-dependent methyltransferase